MAPPVPSLLPPLIRWSNTRNYYTYQFDTTGICNIKYNGQYIWKVLPKGHILDTAEFYNNTIKNPSVHFTSNKDFLINQPSPIVITSQQPPPPAIAFAAPLPPISAPLEPDTMSTQHDKIKVNKPESFNGD